MIRFAPRVGLAFREMVDTIGKTWTLVATTVTKKLKFEDDGGAVETLTRKEFEARWQERKWVIDEGSLGKAAKAVRHVVPADIRSLPEAQRGAVKRRLRYLLAIERSFRKSGGSFVSTVEELSPKIAEAAKQFGDDRPPSSASVWRWWQRFSVTRCVMRLVDGRKNSGRRRDEQVLGVFEEAVNEVFLNIQKYPIKNVWERTQEKIDRLNKVAPPDEQIRKTSRATTYRWVNELYHAIVLRAREGKKVSDRDLRLAQDSVKVQHLLERVEIDHTPLDLLVIDKTTSLVLGRPWLTLAIDRRSRCIVGFYVSFNPPSAHSVLACLRRSILPKADVLKRFPDVKHDWPCQGICRLIACDNGMELHAHDLEEAALEMAIEILYCGVAHPAMKGAIERMFRTLATDLIHQLPGTTFSNPKQRGDYPSEKLAAIDIETLTHLLVKWIVDCYHQRPHRGLGGKTPYDVWKELEDSQIIELPAYPAQLDVIAAHTAHPTIFHYGVQVDNLFYNSPFLKEISMEIEGRAVVEARYQEDDVGFIHVRDPRTDEFVEVPCTNTAYAKGLMRPVHRLVIAEVRKRLSDQWKQSDLVQVRREIEAIVEKALQAKRTIDRKRAAQVLMQDSESVFDDLPVTTTQGFDDGLATTPSVPADEDKGMDDIPEFEVLELAEAA